MSFEQPEIFSEQFELSEADKALLRAYEQTGRSVDQLAYTAEFEKLYQSLQEDGFDWEKQEVFRRLLVLRKAGLLPRLFRPFASAPPETQERTA
jgi:hypothetical protein